MKRLLLPALIALACPAPAWAGAEGPGTPQATAANATFLATAPAPPTGGGVCVIDTGVDTDTDLGGALVGRVAMIGGDASDPADLGAISDTGDPLPKHGTYVAGIIASQIDGTGTNGIWPAARIYSARVFSGGASTAQVSDYVTAIDWCRSRPGMKVINLSLSGLSGATIAQRAGLDNKIAEVRGPLYDINVVAAAGNNGTAATVGYPASSAGVFAVGATDGTGALAPFSNRGAGLDIATLGVQSCLTTNHGTKLAAGDGTSFAAPVVSAVLAAIRSYDPTLSASQAEQLLLDTSDTIGGIKVLNAAQAFRADSLTVAMAYGAPTAARSTAVTNLCVPPAPVAGGGGASTGVGGSPSSAAEDGTSSTPDPSAGGMVLATVAPVPAPIMDAAPPSDNPFATLKPDKPTLRRVTMRRGVLTVKIAGRRRGERALFKVDRRRFLVSSSTLRVHLQAKSWNVISIRLQRPGVGVSEALVVRAHSEF